MGGNEVLCEGAMPGDEMASEAERPKVPKFENEAEEARWWDEHKAMVEENLMQAMRDGTA
jgi:hypothetical protein